MSESQLNQRLKELQRRDEERFLRNAQLAVRHRGARFQLDLWRCSVEYILLGGIPLVGILHYGWSAAEPLAFLMIGLWTSIASDWLRYGALFRAVEAEAKLCNDITYALDVAAVIRRGEKQSYRAGRKAKYDPAAGMIIDTAAGAIATAVVCIAVTRSNPELLESLFAERSFVLGVAGMVAYQWLFTIWEIVNHRYFATSEHLVRVHAGLRGIGLFLLAVLVIMTSDLASEGALSAEIVMQIVNGCFTLFGLCIAASALMLRREVAWLRAYLQSQPPTDQEV